MYLRHSMLALMLAACAIPGVAIASPDVHAGDLDAVRARQSEIQRAITTGDSRYEGMSAQTRAVLLERQVALLGLIEGKSRRAELDEQEQRELSNSLEWIDATLARAEDERLICENRKMLGSNRRERVCVTARQQREQREAARRELQSGDM